MNNSILLQRPDLDPAATGNCDLLIALGDDSFAYAIVENDTKLLRLVFDQQSVTDPGAALARRFNEDGNLQAGFDNIKISFSTSQEMLVPEAVGSEDLTLLADSFFNHASMPYSNAPVSGFIPVFGPERELAALLANDLVATAKKFHRVVASLRLSNADGLHITVGASSSYFLLIRDGKVLFQNQYQVENDDEFCYYLLLVINTLAINGKETEVMVNGLINQEDGRYAILYQYFKQVSFVNPPSRFQDSELLENLPLHYFSALLALDLCE